MVEARLPDDLRREIELLLRDPKYATSNRLRDQARTKLKKLGMIRFDRKAWQWEILPAGRRALESRHAD